MGLDHFLFSIRHRMEFGDDQIAVFHADSDIVQRGRLAFADFLRFGHQIVTQLGRIQVVDVHAEGHGHLSVRVAGRGEGNVRETEHDAPVCRPVEVEHGLGHRHRDAAVAGFHIFQRRADEIGVGVFLKEGEEFGIEHGGSINANGTWQGVLGEVVGHCFLRIADKNVSGKSAISQRRFCLNHFLLPSLTLLLTGRRLL